MTRLTQQEIEMIKREAFDLYPHGLATPVKEGANIIRRIAHAKAATKYFLQLKEERERGKKLLEAEEERINYWVSRCMAAEQCIEKSPCDPDVTKEQIEAHRIWEAAKKNENNNQ